MPGRSLVTFPLPVAVTVSGNCGAFRCESHAESCTSHHEPEWP